MKRSCLIRLGFALMAGLLAGCSGAGDTKDKTGLGISENEIFTYERIDPGKTTITVGRAGNVELDLLCKTFMEANPDIQVVDLDITAGNGTAMPYLDWLKYGYRPDVMFLGARLNEEIEVEDYFEDITSNEVISRYEIEALNNMEVDGRIYTLPGPASIDGLYYNKTLFEAYGWEVPRTMDEFIALCQQIDKDTNGTVQAWNPNAKYEKEFLAALQAFTYTELFAGLENRAWYNEFLAGTATFESHMQPFYDLYQRFIDAGIMKEEYFDYSGTTRAEEYLDGKIVMMNYVLHRKMDSSQYEFEFMPFPTTVGRDGYLTQNLSYSVCLPVKERTEKEREATQRFLAYISTPEAQNVYINKAVMISSVADSSESSESLPEELRKARDSGHMFTAFTFKNKEMPSDYLPLKLMRADMISILKGELTASEAMKHMDAAHTAALNGKTDIQEEVIATAGEDFTILETSHYFADLFREKTGADVALVLNNVAERGNLMRIFKGDLTNANVETLRPRSLANHSQLVKVKMTGSQLLEVLNHPYGGIEKDADCIYAFSGLKCKVAPWNVPGEKILSVTLADGSPIDEKREYMVAFWDQTVHEAYITEVLETYEGTFDELLTEKLKADQVITPARDGRIELQWN
ncbi:MAG: extracellular solute-binding protein [Lachnospiraceae bacterium]|nr:extracellular solute-binding protein [Lachnospiraceae bacterium]